MKKEYLKQVRDSKPIVHSITNYVTVNDCANILLACGASPIMADAKEEVEEITSICDALYLNIGTPSFACKESMLLAGRKANALGHPIVLDPVGVGASSLRTEIANTLIEELSIDVIRGNISEIKALAMGSHSVQGVDAAVADTVTKDNLEEMITFIKMFAKKTKAIIIVTGAIDIVTDSEKTYVIENGHPMMSSVTGTGCMLSALVGAYISANKHNMLEAAALAVSSMGLCGEIAYQRLSLLDGNASYRNYIIDAMARLDDEQLLRGLKCGVYG